MSSVNIPIVFFDLNQHFSILQYLSLISETILMNHELSNLSKSAFNYSLLTLEVAMFFSVSRMLIFTRGNTKVYMFTAKNIKSSLK